MMSASAFYDVPTSDWLSVTTPKETGSLVSDDVRDVLSSVPGLSASPEGGWIFPEGGCVRVRSMGLVSVFSASGGALVALRGLGLFADYLRALSSESHRVTRLDAALDIPVAAPPVLQALYARGKAGNIRLSHKAVSPQGGVRRYESPNAGGDDTGTVYLGGKQAKVKARVYDKRQERIDKGYPDPGPLTRYELIGTSDIGVSLKDAWEPSSFFWHYMRGILPMPPDVPVWVPGGEGFSLPPRRALDAAEVFQRRLERSAELRDLAMQALAVQGGSWRLLTYLRKMGVAMPSGHQVPPIDAPTIGAAV